MKAHVFPDGCILLLTTGNTITGIKPEVEHVPVCRVINQGIGGDVVMDPDSASIGIVDVEGEVQGDDTRRMSPTPTKDQIDRMEKNRKHALAIRKRKQNTLTTEQLNRMEKNRKRALDIQKKK